MILRGWKDIAKYLGCGVRTAQRWEALGLPVRRPSGDQGAVVALRKDIDSWLRSESSSRITPELGGYSPRKFRYRILIADNDEKLLVTMSTHFTRDNYEVRTARDGFEALAVMRDSLPDLLISALRMPNMSGFEFLSVVRRRFPSISVIAISGEFAPAVAPDVLCDQYIDKGPRLRSKLVAAVRGLLSRSPLRAQPAKLDKAPVWLVKPSNGYLVLTCPSCLRSFPLAMRSVILGKDARTTCDYCATETKYHIDDSDLPMADQLKEVNQHLHQRRRPESEN